MEINAAVAVIAVAVIANTAAVLALSIWAARLRRRCADIEAYLGVKPVDRKLARARRRAARRESAAAALISQEIAAHPDEVVIGDETAEEAPVEAGTELASDEGPASDDSDPTAADDPFVAFADQHLEDTPSEDVDAEAPVEAVEEPPAVDAVGSPMTVHEVDALSDEELLELLSHGEENGIAREILDRAIAALSAREAAAASTMVLDVGSDGADETAGETDAVAESELADLDPSEEADAEPTWWQRRRAQKAEASRQRRVAAAERAAVAEARRVELAERRAAAKAVAAQHRAENAAAREAAKAAAAADAAIAQSIRDDEAQRKADEKAAREAERARQRQERRAARRRGRGAVGDGTAEGLDGAALDFDPVDTVADADDDSADPVAVSEMSPVVEAAPDEWDQDDAVLVADEDDAAGADTEVVESDDLGDAAEVWDRTAVDSPVVDAAPIYWDQDDAILADDPTDDDVESAAQVEGPAHLVADVDTDADVEVPTPWDQDSSILLDGDENVNVLDVDEEVVDEVDERAEKERAKAAEAERRAAERAAAEERKAAERAEKERAKAAEAERRAAERAEKERAKAEEAERRAAERAERERAKSDAREIRRAEAAGRKEERRAARLERQAEKRRSADLRRAKKLGMLTDEVDQPVAARLLAQPDVDGDGHDWSIESGFEGGDTSKRLFDWQDAGLPEPLPERLHAR